MSEQKRSVILYVVSLVVTAVIFFIMGLTAPALVGLERTIKTEFVYPSESGTASSDTVDKPTTEAHKATTASAAQSRPVQKSTKAEQETTSPTVGKEKIEFPVCLNTATKDELMAIPGIGEKTAAAIIDYRNEVGYIFYIEELMAIDGIGEGKCRQWAAYLTID